MIDPAHIQEFFLATPPRLHPQAAHQRPMIQTLLAQLAATDPAEYENRLKIYNDLCKAQGVSPFPKVVVVTQTEQDAKIPAPVTTLDPPVKKRKRSPKKS